MGVPLKSATTTVPVKRTQQAIVSLLRKFGAREFGFDEDPRVQTASVRFMYPAEGDRLLPVRIDVDVPRVHARLYPVKPGSYTKAALVASRKQQAHRTAWRLLYDWLDTALNTCAMGIQEPEDVFMAFTFVRLEDGSMVQVRDYARGALAGGSLPRLLGSGS